MDKRIIWTDQVYRDIDSSADYISKDSEYYAASFINAVLSRTERGQSRMSRFFWKRFPRPLETQRHSSLSPFLFLPGKTTKKTKNTMDF